MSRQDVELVRSLFESGGDGEIDVAEHLEDEAWLREVTEAVSDDAKIRFYVPEQSGIEVMERSEFTGPEGLAEGWRIWMQPWEQFRIALEETIDIGDGVVLAPARMTGKLRESGIEIPQEGASLQRVEDGRIVSMGFYLDVDQAREAAGLT